MRIRALGMVSAFLCACASGQVAHPVADAAQSIPADFMLTTRATAWRVRVEGDVLELSGDQGQRRLAIERNEALFDGRVVSARDDIGTLEVRVTERLCIDDKSGQQFPYTGRMTMDDRAAVAGCGGPLR